MKSNETNEERAAVKLQQETELRDLLNHLYDLQINSSYPHYHTLESGLIGSTKVKLSIMSCPEEYSTFYDSKITVDEDRWKDICFHSVKQSETAVWFKERHIRLTASKRVHRVKTGTDNFDSLAVQFKNEQYKGAMTKAMHYGLVMEYSAKIALSAMTGTTIYDIGLVICAKQPFLACSPDGIIVNGTEMELIEIKCPYSCKDSVIIDKNENKSLVDYLILNALGEPELKQTHVYYTQIQTSLYVTGLASCKLFVYSQHDCVLVNVFRNEQFLKTVIPKIEYFYFKYFLPIILKNTWK
ncbi:unnamed protein product [Lasius platythorax]|uniref:YqaJ viral recombinase domain-containing protein n=1 Tax=Lasius platythorax TaxID=488582 RepID=A0AAV2MWA6_9HYME